MSQWYMLCIVAGDVIITDGTSLLVQLGTGGRAWE